VIAWILSGRIVRPLRQIGKDASVLARGDLTHRTMIRTTMRSASRRYVQPDGGLARAAGRGARRAAIEVRQAKDTLAAVIDASPVAIICSDVNRCIVMWNRAAEQIFGHTAVEALGRPTKLVPPGGAAESQALFERALSGETCATCMLSASARTIPWST